MFIVISAALKFGQRRHLHCWCVSDRAQAPPKAMVGLWMGALVAGPLGNFIGWDPDNITILTAFCGGRLVDLGY